VVTDFIGPHPAGNVGTHIHFLDPVHRLKTVWHIGLQDVIGVGKLFTTGKLYVERVVSLAGPSVARPRLLRTRIGASLPDLTEGQLKNEESRVLSGSVLSGRSGIDAFAYLGRYHQQITVLPEQHKRIFLGWLDPGLNLYSVKNIVLSKLLRNKKFAFGTSKNGEVRAILPSYNYEKVMPLDLMPLFLMRALAVDDVEEAESLGCLELDEEDLALCAFVCPSKLEFGPLLRKNLTLIEKEG
jgi:Na+-transporting NADH:ubiquinone oxidoreductase subunit A